MKKVVTIFAALCFFLGMLGMSSSYAQDQIVNRTGTIKITQPNGTVLVVSKDEPLPDIPAGSIVEIITGSADIVPEAGEITVVIGTTEVQVEAGQHIAVSIDVMTGGVSIESKNGAVKAVTNGVTVQIPTGAKTAIEVNPSTGAVSVEAVRGSVTVVSATGESVVLSQGEAAEAQGKAAAGEEVTETTEVITEEEPTENELSTESPSTP